MIRYLICFANEFLSDLDLGHVWYLKDNTRQSRLAFPELHLDISQFYADIFLFI
jgi:hypothetical protein